MGLDAGGVTEGAATIPTKPLISVVLPNFNHAKYIEENFKGLLGQTYENWELIVVDDASTDHSRDIISRYASLDKRIKPIYLDKNLGFFGAFNVGLEEVSGTYLYGSGSDDFICNEVFFERSVRAFDSFPDIAGVFMQTMMIDGETDSPWHIEGCSERMGYISPDQAVVDFFEGKLIIPGASSLWRIDMFMDIGYLDYFGAQSDTFVNHVLSFMHGVYYIEGVGVKMRRSSSTYSGSQTNDDFFIRAARIERSILDFIGVDRVSPDLRRQYRLNMVNNKCRFYLPVRFIDMARGFNFQPWEYDGLSDRLIAARQWMLEQAEAMEQEMNATFADASSVFDRIAGKL